MGKVQRYFGYGAAGTVTRSIDDVIISVRNASDSDIAFGAPVFLTDYGAVNDGITLFNINHFRCF